MIVSSQNYNLLAADLAVCTVWRLDGQISWSAFIGTLGASPCIHLLLRLLLLLGIWEGRADGLLGDQSLLAVLEYLGD